MVFSLMLNPLLVLKCEGCRPVVVSKAGGGWFAQVLGAFVCMKLCPIVCCKPEIQYLIDLLTHRVQSSKSSSGSRSQW